MTTTQPEHHILIWSCDDFINDVLCYAVRRLGYRCDLFDTNDTLDQYAHSKQPQLFLFIIGPHMPVDEVQDRINALRQDHTVEVLFLVRNTPPDPASQTAVSGSRPMQHFLPLDLYALNDTVQDLLSHLPQK